jgi:hypothetical protein
VGRAEQPDAAFVAQALEQRELLAPGDEIVDLVEVDAPAVPGVLVRTLLAAAIQPIAA